MPDERYPDLLKEMPRISKAVNEFKSETVQQSAFDALVTALGIRLEPDTPQRGVKRKISKQGSRKGAAPKPKKLKRGGASQTGGEGRTAAKNAADIVNKIKQRPDFKKVEERVLHAGRVWDQTRLVLLTSDDHFTSGEILSVLKGFDLRTGKPAVSRALKKEMGSLLTTGPRTRGARIGYKLSGPARKTAQKWLDDQLK